MGVRVLIGEAGTSHAAAMYCSSSGAMIGPLWESPDAEEQIEAFLDWMRLEKYLVAAEEIDLGTLDIPHPLLANTDPRVWPDSGLAKLVAYWRAHYVGEDGLLRDAEHVQA